MRPRVMPILGAALLAAAPWHAAAALAGLAVPPAPATLAQAPTRGALLYDTHCSGCHTTQMHWRDRRVVRDWAGLVDQVAQWAARERLGWGEADVLAVARHLDETIYRLPRPQQRADGASPPARAASAQRATRR